MSRYVFSTSQALDAKALVSARQAARGCGATVLKSLAGTLLVEAGPAQLAEVAQALPGWTCTPERRTTRVPERKPLERAKARAVLGASAKG